MSTIPRLSMIVAMTEERVIGDGNDLPWHLSEDLKRFRRITTPHPIIMGRKTFESIGRPLPKRRNLVLSRNSNYRPDGVEVFSDLENAVASCQGEKEAFVIGGSYLFSQALPSIGRLYLTRIHHPFSGDVFFPDIDLEKDFQIVEQTTHHNDGPPAFDYSYVTYDRR